MSWQAYVDQSLVATGNLDKAAIFDKTGASSWAASAGYTIDPKEVAEIAKSFDDKGDANGVRKISGSGFDLAGEHFITLRADERSLYGKKGKEGVVIVRTTQALLIAHYPETVQPGSATNTVEQLADYLIGVGY